MEAPHRQAGRGLFIFPLSGHSALIHLPLTCNSSSSSSSSPQVAASNGRVQATSLLLERGASVNLANHWGMTALINAALWGHDEVAALLLAKGADPTLRCNKGWDALTAASMFGFVSIVRRLLHATPKVGQISTQTDKRHSKSRRQRHNDQSTHGPYTRAFFYRAAGHTY